jgi:aconitase A
LQGDAAEVDYYDHGGILQMVLRRMVAEGAG